MEGSLFGISSRIHSRIILFFIAVLCLVLIVPTKTYAAVILTINQKGDPVPNPGGPGGVTYTVNFHYKVTESPLPSNGLIPIYYLSANQPGFAPKPVSPGDEADTLVSLPATSVNPGQNTVTFVLTDDQGRVVARAPLTFDAGSSSIIGAGPGPSSDSSDCNNYLGLNIISSVFAPFRPGLYVACQIVRGINGIINTITDGFGGLFNVVPL